jgi:hypothetical protein
MTKLVSWRDWALERKGQALEASEAFSRWLCVLKNTYRIGVLQSGKGTLNN